MEFQLLSGDQIRQLTDCQQVFEAWQEADRIRRRRFTGSMRWVERNGSSYLLRKIDRRERSLGPRSTETEAIMSGFQEGRARNSDRLAGLAARLDQMAPVNRALRLGRLPTIAARILRRFDGADLLGTSLLVVGTNAMFAFETMAGVQLSADMIATADIDLLLDARRSLNLAAMSAIGNEGLLGILKQVDRSFELPRARSFRAANRDGYLVDLIRPQQRDPSADRSSTGLTDVQTDMEAAEIAGLNWLVNAPKVAATVIDQRGYPVRIVAIDPRAFALHKAWVATRMDREPAKARRDLAQAGAAAAIAANHLHLSFDASDLSALPTPLRERAADLLPADETARDAQANPQIPNW